MTKIIIILSGSPSLKNKFDEVIRGDIQHWRYNRWNANPNDPIKTATNIILKAIGKGLSVSGLSGTDNSNTFFNELFQLVEKHFGYKETYVRKMIERFHHNTKVQVMVMHGVGRDLTAKLVKEGLVHTVFLSEADVAEKNPLYEVTIFDGENFEETVIETLKNFENK